MAGPAAGDLRGALVTKPESHFVNRGLELRTINPHNYLEILMPYLDCRIGGSHSPEVSAKVALALTDLTAEVLKKKREVTAVAVDFVPSEQWYIGGASLAGQPHKSFYLDIKVTEGTNTKDEKAVFISRVFKAIEGIVGSLNPASYIVIHEVRADSWGYQAQTQEFRYVKGKPL